MKSEPMADIDDKNDGIPSLEPFEKSAGILMDKANRIFHKRLLRHVGRLKITTLEWYVIRAVATHDGLSIKEIGDLIQRASCQLIGIIDRLEAKNIVKREVRPDNRRVTRICLTPAGKDFLRYAAPKREEILTSMGLSHEEREQLADLLEKVVRSGQER